MDYLECRICGGHIPKTPLSIPFYMRDEGTCSLPCLRKHIRVLMVKQSARFAAYGVLQLVFSTAITIPVYFLLGVAHEQFHGEVKDMVSNVAAFAGVVVPVVAMLLVARWLDVKKLWGIRDVFGTFDRVPVWVENCSGGLCIAWIISMIIASRFFVME